MELWYENQIGDTLDLVNAREYALTAATGLASLPSNSITTVQTASPEGDTVTNRRRGSRQVTLTHRIALDVKAVRLRFARILDQGATGRLRYRDNAMDVYLDVEVEDCEVNNTDEATTAVTTFRAAFPYFRDIEAETAANRAITGAWRFPFTFPVTFGSMSVGQSLTVENEGGVEHGFTLRVTANGGSVANPKVTNQNGQQIAYVGTLTDGQVLEVTTATGAKSATLAGQNVLYRLTEETELFHLKMGRNVITPSASSGGEFMDVEVVFEAPHKAV